MGIRLPNHTIILIFLNTAGNNVDRYVFLIHAAASFLRLFPRRGFLHMPIKSIPNNAEDTMGP